MDWWNDLTDWISSDDGWRVISGAIIPFVAIIVAGIVAALIGRGATKRVVTMQEREARNAAVAGIVSAARKAATWGSLGHDERAYADHLAEDADIRLRLLPVSGAPLAANWTQHEIADIKKNSSTFSFQAEQSLAEFRDRILEWQARPNRARKLFKSDLERWKFDAPDPDAELISRQQDWNADQAATARPTDSAATAGAPADRPTPTTTSLRPAPTSAPAAGAPAGTVATDGTTTTAGADTASRAGTGSAAASTAASPSGAGFSVTRGGSTPADPNATTPISDTTSTNRTTPISDANATRAYGDDAAPARAPLGSPASPAGARGPVTASGPDSDNADAVDDDRPSSPRVTDRTGTGARDAEPRETDATSRDTTGSTGTTSSTGRTGSTSTTGSAATNATGAPVPPPIAKPTSADAHVNRTANADARGVDAPAAAGTRSVPTRIADGPAEPADANETSEAPYTQPISASELRRRAADDDE